MMSASVNTGRTRDVSIFLSRKVTLRTLKLRFCLSVHTQRVGPGCRHQLVCREQDGVSLLLPENRRAKDLGRKLVFFWRPLRCFCFNHTRRVSIEERTIEALKNGTQAVISDGEIKTVYKDLCSGGVKSGRMYLRHNPGVSLKLKQRLKPLMFHFADAQVDELTERIGSCSGIDKLIKKREFQFLDLVFDVLVPELLLGRFAAECEAAGMRVSTSKSMVLDRKRVACQLLVGGEVLPQVEEFKYLGVLFTSDGRRDREIDRRIGSASAVMRMLNRSVVVKRELSQKARLSIYRSIYVPILTYGHEHWVMTERTRSRIQAAKMSFLRRVAGLSLRDRVRSSDIREGLGVEPLLLRIERS
nr:uncharacterized protein LOC129164434 [Nothobranchius furzeri]